ncbi:MAG TPA: ABC transporter substrate-binding protein, partial [Acetobacteraceae bacterium]|nr:ABC transporter substrate-binding protein [Acetobacteraceae bacterium]
MPLSRRALLAASVVAPAVGATHRARAASVIRSVPIGNLQVLDPIWTTAYITRNHAYMIWDTLFALDAANKPQPQMVDSHEVSADGTAYTFRLRPGLEWHDGTPVRAADCVASIRRWSAKDGMGRALMAATKGLAPLDDRTFRLTLARPVGFVIDALGKIDSNVPFMMPERLAQTDPNTQIKEMIGSGPFRFITKEWVPGVKVVYEKFQGYVPRAEPSSQAAGGKVVKVDRVESLYTPDASTATNGLITAEFDLLESPAPDLIPLLRKSANVTVEPNDPLGYQLFMVLNHLLPPFDKLPARQALLMAIKQSAFLLATVGDQVPSRECAAAFGCTTSDPEQAALGWPPYDLAKAKALFASSGYDGTPVVVMDPADNAVLHPSALVAADTLRAIGAKVDLQSMDWSTLVQRRA